MTVTEFADHLGVSRDTVNKWVNGTRRPQGRGLNAKIHHRSCSRRRARRVCARSHSRPGNPDRYRTAVKLIDRLKQLQRKAEDDNAKPNAS